MEINRAAFGALAVLGVVAAGGGAYLANRHNETAMPHAQTAAMPVAGVVTETETTIADVPAPAPARTRSGFGALPAALPEPERAARSTPAPAARSTAPRPVSASRPESMSRPAPARQEPSNPPTTLPPAHRVERTVPPAIEPTDTTGIERVAAVPEEPRRIFDELVIPADSVIGLQIEDAVTSDRARLEDDVIAHVARDVRVRDQVAIPAGSRVEGSITLVEQGGRVKERARLGIRFHTIVLADGTRLPINTDTIYREGESPARESAAKIGGGAVGGAVLGAIFGGRKGAVIGSTVGAAGGGAAVAMSEPNAATLPAGSTVTVRMGSPTTVTVER
jgi:hypothetical protein